MRAKDAGKQEMVTMKEAVIYRINRLCQIHGLSIYELAKVSGVSQSTLNEIMQGRSENPRINTFKKISSGFGIKLQEFFDDPVFEHIEGID